ncbi:lactonase family protein [Rhizobium sp. NFR12]|uniref:lactonase family protein n=1 Tax=Rhizobium sp. NFR12 TaxID=1566261 RepID=UPI0008A78FA2|nr:lactonase family protein [Rhizobium sp. NFR12]SEH29967.1 6-phosphogluconolactonase [Rhizobium sp. NFR12]
MDDLQTARVIIGSYTESMPHVEGKGKGVSLLSLDLKTARFEEVAAFEAVRNPTYLAQGQDGRVLYAVEEVDDEAQAGVVVLQIDGDGGLKLAKRVSARGSAPCHVTLDRSGERLFVANYGSGSAVAYGLDHQGLPNDDEVMVIQRTGSGPVTDRQEGPHVHQVLVMPGDRHVLVCDLGTDEIARYAFGDQGIGSEPDVVLHVSGGSLPRHIVCSQDGRRLYVAHEAACTVRSYAIEGDNFTLLSETSTVPADFAGTSSCAAIKIHPNGRFLYVSNRGHDTIVACEILADGGLRTLGWYPTMGRTPRDFAIDPTGRYLIVANQDSHSLVFFELNGEHGTLTTIGEPFEIGSPVCVLFA